MMTGDPVTAIDAQNIGMIYKTFKEDEFEESSFKLALKLANMPTKALGLTKKLLNKSLNNDLETQLEEEKKYQKLAGETNDYTEGVASFLEKRKPKFKGN